LRPAATRLCPLGRCLISHVSRGAEVGGESDCQLGKSVALFAYHLLIL